MSAPTTDARSRERSKASAAPTPSRPSVTSRAVVLALVVGTLVVAFSMPARAWFAQRAQIASLRADVEAAQQRVTDLQVQQQRWQDPAFVAAEARRRLHFVLPGEVGYVTLGSAAAANQSGKSAAPDAAWYATLWGALQEADDHAATSAK